METIKKEETMSSALDELFTQIKSKLDSKQDQKQENDEGLSTSTSYSQLEASITADDTQYKYLEKSFPISKSVLKENLPALFKIIDTISVNNIIYEDSGMVNMLLNNILFSELKKIDKNVEGFYKTIELDKQPSTCDGDTQNNPTKPSYEPLDVVYKIEQKAYILTYPDFLEDAFTTIVNKIQKNPLLAKMVTIKQGTKSASMEQTVEQTVAATTLAATLATIAAVENAKLSPPKTSKLPPGGDVDDKKAVVGSVWSWPWDS